MELCSILSTTDHEFYMNLAIEQARLAAKKGEVPVGAVIICNDQVIAKAHNLKELNRCPTHHAEILVIEEASRQLEAWRLSDCDLYVTLEPCVMCSGALVQSRVRRLIYGTPDPKGGGATSLYHILGDVRLNHQVEVIGPILQQSCAELLTSFFRSRRKKADPSS